ncbi:MAG: radical SAM protein [Spirochaetota bacterium]
MAVNDFTDFQLKQVDDNNLLLIFGKRVYLFHAPSLRTFLIDGLTRRIIESYGKYSLYSDTTYGNRYPEEQIKSVVENIKRAGIFDSENKEELLNQKNRYYARSPQSRCLTLNLAHNCNLNCRYCYANHGNYKNKSDPSCMPYETAQQAVDYYLNSSNSDSSNKSIDFSGGEPLLNFEVLQAIVSYIEKKIKNIDRRLTLTVITNGLLLSEDKLDFLNRHNVHIAVSIDGDEKIHDANRITKDGTGSYNLIIENIKYMLKKKPELFSARTTITPAGTDVLRICNHLESLGFKEYTFDIAFGDSGNPSPLWDQAHFKKYDENYGYYTASILNYLLNIEKKCTGFVLDRLYRIHRRVHRTLACRMSTSLLVVTPTGEFYPCYKLTELENFRIGSVYEGVNQIRAKELFPKMVFEKSSCNACWARYLCGGGCPAASFIENGKDETPDYWICRSRLTVWKWALWLYIKLKEAHFPFQAIIP